MRKVLALMVLLLSNNLLLAQQPDAIVGEWLSEQKTGRIQIYRQGSQYYGRLSWLEDNTVLDAHNPDPARQLKPLIGTVILTKFTYKKTVWEGGDIYDPQSGKTYFCVMRLENNDVLKIRGYIGFSFLGRTTSWRRTKGTSPISQ